MNLKALFAALVIAGFAMVGFTASAFACDGHDETAEATPGEVSPTELATMLDAGAVAVDANSADTRTSAGIVPGAILLSGYEFESSELPADTNTELVFYCYSEQCSAAPQAAGHAMELGYTNVSVMPQGIQGWTEAGYETVPQS